MRVRSITNQYQALSVRGEGSESTYSSTATGTAAEAASKSSDAGLGDGLGRRGSGSRATLNLNVVGSHDLAKTSVGRRVVLAQRQVRDTRARGRGGRGSKVIKLLEDELHVSVRAIVLSREGSGVLDNSRSLVAQDTLVVEGEVVSKVVVGHNVTGALASNTSVEESNGVAPVIVKYVGVIRLLGLGRDAEGGGSLELLDRENVAVVRDGNIAKGHVEHALDAEPVLGDGAGREARGREGKLESSNLLVGSIVLDLSLGHRGKGSQGGRKESSTSEDHLECEDIENRVCGERRKGDRERSADE